MISTNKRKATFEDCSVSRRRTYDHVCASRRSLLHDATRRFAGDNFAFVGTRATGSDAGHYAIIGPNWSGTVPDGVVELPHAITPWAYLVGRTLIDDPEDLDAVHAIQDQYKLTSLSQFVDRRATPNQSRNLFDMPDPEDPLGDWKIMNLAMAENPPHKQYCNLLDMFSRIGIGPGLDVELQTDVVKKALARAAVDAIRIIDDSFAAGYAQTQVNGWWYPPAYTGIPTAAEDWLFRAYQAHVGFLAVNQEEAVYLNVSTDANGNLLMSENNYTIRFEADGQPDVKAFWSISMYNSLYNSLYNLAESPIIVVLLETEALWRCQQRLTVV